MATVFASDSTKVQVKHNLYNMIGLRLTLLTMDHFDEILQRKNTTELVEMHSFQHKSTAYQ